MVCLPTAHDDSRPVTEKESVRPPDQKGGWPPIRRRVVPNLQVGVKKKGGPMGGQVVARNGKPARSSQVRRLNGTVGEIPASVASYAQSASFPMHFSARLFAYPASPGVLREDNGVLLLAGGAYRARHVNGRAPSRPADGDARFAVAVGEAARLCRLRRLLPPPPFTCLLWQSWGSEARRRKGGGRFVRAHLAMGKERMAIRTRGSPPPLVAIGSPSSLTNAHDPLRSFLVRWAMVPAGRSRKRNRSHLEGVGVSRREPKERSARQKKS